MGAEQSREQPKHSAEERRPHRAAAWGKYVAYCVPKLKHNQSVAEQVHAFWKACAVAEGAWGSCAAAAVKASGLAGQTPLRLKETSQLLPSSHALLVDMFGKSPDTIVCWQDCRACKQLVALNTCLGMQESCRQCTSCTRGDSSAAPSRMPRNLWRSLVGACSR